MHICMILQVHLLWPSASRQCAHILFGNKYSASHLYNHRMITRKFVELWYQCARREEAEMSASEQEINHLCL